MKQLIVLLVLLFSFVCEGQTKTEDIDYKDIVEIKGLVYLKADTSLVSGKVIRYNNKNEAKKYILVSKGKIDESGWMDIKDNDIKYLKKSPNPLFGINSYNLNRNNMNYVNDRINLERNNTISVDVEKNGIYKDEEVKINNINIEDEKDGVWEEYYDNGQMKSKGNYIKEKKDGLWKEWYENGKLLGRINYKDGKENGIMEVYHNNGQLMMKGVFRDAIQMGEWEYYDENGELIKTENFGN